MSLLKGISNKIKGKGSDNNLAVKKLVEEKLRTVIDPDLNRDIVSLGFVKDINVTGTNVKVTIELTTPACPVKEQMQAQCEELIRAIGGVESVEVTMTAQTRGASGKKGSAEVAAALGQVKNLIAVASGKGGVGKSTSTVSIARSLAAMGSKVGILDADVYGPSISLMTGAPQPTESDGDMIKPSVVDGMKVISVAMFSQAGQASIMRGPMVAQIIKQFLTQISWGELDYLLIDYPPGTGDIQLTLSQVAPISGAVIVTTPQEVALIDVRKAVSMFGTMKVPVLGVVETMSYFKCDGCDKKHRIFGDGGGLRVGNEYGLPLLGEIPLDPSVAKLSDEGKSVVIEAPKSETAKAYLDAAGKIASQLSILNAQDQNALTQFALDWEH